MLRKLFVSLVAITLATSLIPTSANASVKKEEFTRRISRINEYDDNGVTETHTFQYNKDGSLASFTTTYYENGKPQGKDEWKFQYDDGKMFAESMENEKGYHGYTHITFGEKNEKTGYQILYGRGIQQQFTFTHDKKGRISRITGEGIHDWLYESDMAYTYDEKEQTATCTGTVSSTENAEFEVTKNYDFSYPGVVFVEEQNVLNGQELPTRYYLRVDMPKYISLPEVEFVPDDEIKTDKDGYITKLLNEKGALRCELYFDYIKK